MKRSTPFYVVGGILGVAGIAVYVYSRRRGGDVHGLAGETRKKNGMLLTVHRSRRMPIKERLGHMQDLVWESVKDPAIRKLALQITNHCPARDGECETRAIYNWTRNNIRYTGDIAPIKMGRNGPTEGVDLFQSGLRTTEFKGGDCDDHSVLNATLLALNGITPKFRVTAPRGGGPDSWSHVYVVSGLPKTNPQRWVPVDTTLPGNYYAREAPHGKRADFTHFRHMYDVAA